MRIPFTVFVLSAVLTAGDGKLRLLTPSEWQAALAPESLTVEDPKVRVDWIQTNVEGVAVGGYDLVTFFKGTNPAKGKSEFAYEYREVKFYFRSQANREEFVKDPRSYLPQFGGFCAYSVAKGKPVPGHPAAWRILSGKLYLLESPAILMSWERDNNLLEATAQSLWPRLHR